MRRRIIRVKWFKALKVWGFWDSYYGCQVVRNKKPETIGQARVTCRRFWDDNHILAQLVVHKKDGQIEFENTYGKDPRRSKG